MATILQIEGDRVFTSKTIFNTLITTGSVVSLINTFSGDGSQVTFTLSKTPFDSDNLSVIVDDTPMIQDTDYTYEVVSDNPTITFTTAPSSGTDNIVIGETFTYEPNKYKYYVAAHYYDSDEVDTLLQDKVDIEQGVTNANKLVATDSNGDINTFTNILTLTGRKSLDLSAFDGTVTDKFKDLSTLSTGSYDVVKSGYICSDPLGSDPQNRQSEVMEGSVLTLDSNGYCVFFDTEGIINVVDVRGTEITNWVKSDLQTEKDVDDKLVDYLSKTEATSTYQKKNRYITNTSVALTDWVEEQTPTYADYPYAATIVISGVTANNFVDVVFDVESATSGKIAPIVESVAGGIKIYASEAVAITIPTIKVEG